MEATRPGSPEADSPRLGPRSRAAALIVYFDTSALIKLLVLERGSELAEELWERAATRTSSWLVYPEARAALAAAGRDGRIARERVKRTLQDLEGACTGMRLIGVDGALAKLAGELAQRHALRGYDAVHLATALAVAAPDLVLATWDGDLARAAVDEGCSVAPA